MGKGDEARSAPYVDTWRRGYRQGWVDALSWSMGKNDEEIETELRERKQFTRGDPKGDTVGGSPCARGPYGDAQPERPIPAEVPAPLTLSNDDPRPNSPDDLGGYQLPSELLKGEMPGGISGTHVKREPPPGLGPMALKLWENAHPDSRGD
jgi:hypothetical protein